MNSFRPPHQTTPRFIVLETLLSMNPYDSDEHRNLVVAPVYDHEGKLQRAIFCIFGVPGGTCSAELRDFLNPRHDAQLQVERYGAGRVKISNKGIIEAFTRLAIGELPLMKKPQGDIAASETVGGDDDDDDDDDL